MRSYLVVLSVLIMSSMTLVGCGPSQAEKNLKPDVLSMSKQSLGAKVANRNPAAVEEWANCQTKVAAAKCGDACKTVDGAGMFLLTVSEETGVAIAKACPQEKYIPSVKTN
jgi:hypothetical protein